MQFTQPLLSGTLIKRYKRFLADVRLDDGQQVTAHTANTGGMLGCAEPGSRVWLSVSNNPRRKYRYTWELVEASASLGSPRDKVLVGINTQLSNQLVKEAILQEQIPELAGYEQVHCERRYGKHNSRIDLLLMPGEHQSGRVPCYVEIKNVTLVDSGSAFFPDAVTARGAKHLQELQYMVELGHRAVIFFCVQRGDVNEVRPAAQIDPHYTNLLTSVLNKGVQALAYRWKMSTEAIELDKALPVRI